MLAVRLFIITLVMLSVPHAFASDYRQPGGGSSGSDTNTTLFTGSSIFPLTGTATVYLGSTVSETRTNAEMIVGADTTVTNIRLDLSVAPGGSKEYTVSLMKGSSALASVVLSGAEVNETISTTQTYSAGDMLSLRVVPTNSPAATILTWSANADFN